MSLGLSRFRPSHEFQGVHPAMAIPQLCFIGDELILELQLTCDPPGGQILTPCP